MTKDQAIYILRNTAWLGSNEDRERTEEAVKMAIEALSAEKTQLSGEDATFDCISRQDAIDAVMNTEPVVFDMQTLEPHQKTKDVIKAIQQLPSAEKTGRWIDIDSETYTWKIRCDQCGHERSMMSTQGRYPRFCEGCGADMRGESE